MADKKSKVNEAGNYTMPGMRKKLIAQIKASGYAGKITKIDVLDIKCCCCSDS